jgi:hypothetical protein
MKLLIPIVSKRFKGLIRLIITCSRLPLYNTIQPQFFTNFNNAFLLLGGKKLLGLDFYNNNFFNTYHFNKLEIALQEQEDALDSMMLFNREELMLTQLHFFFEDEDNEVNAEFHSSTPEVKLYYPEPFVASPSFVHEEL